MNQQDIIRFSQAWKAAWETAGQAPTDSAIALSFKILSKYDLREIENALVAHLETSQFKPTPADIIAQITKNDGRPEPDEAWSIALESFDEYKTVILNDEIAGALSSAREIYNDGDRTGARMAFKAAYEKKISKARSNGNPVKWWPSRGHDVEGRKAVLESAVEQGLLPKESAPELLTGPITPEGQKLIEQAFEETKPETLEKSIEEMKEILK